MHDDTPWLVEAIEPMLLGVKGHIAALDEGSRAAVAIAIAEAAQAGYVQGVAALRTQAELKLAAEGVAFTLPTLHVGEP